MRARNWLGLIVCLVASAGCNKDNGLYCEGHPDDPSCASPDTPTACTSNDQCSAPNPVCDVAGSKTCVQCIVPSETGACVGTSPVCGSDHACRGCALHTECTASAACLPDGSCAVEGDVAYVQAAGSGSACTKAAPCGTLDAGVQANKPYVKVASGLVKDTKTTTIDGKVVTILAEPGAKLDRDGDGAILEVRSANANVKIFDLEITGQTGISDFAITVVPNGGTPSLALTRANVSSNQGGGISFLGGTLTVTRSTLSGNQGGGLVMNANGVVTVTNSFIHHNGNTTTTSFGGLSLRPTGASKVEFNTIIDNQANLGAASAGGVFCDTAGFVASNNIIFRNTGGTAGNVQTFGNCTYGNSFNMAGTSAVDNTPSFASPNTQPFDYRLTATSPPSVRDAAGTCAGVDFDGDTRPGGAACDLGADEFKP